MKAYCHHCQRILRLWELKCPYCYRSTMSWLHLIVIAASGGAAILYLFKFL
jgi:RNA polymerase subunit RPABC4/transcription elongation factor Spt4